MVGIKRVVKFSKLKNFLNSKQTEYSNELNRLKIEKQKERERESGREREKERERMGQNIQNIWEKIAENFLYNIVNLLERAQKQLFAVVLMQIHKKYPWWSPIIVKLHNLSLTFKHNFNLLFCFSIYITFMLPFYRIPCSIVNYDN